MTNNIQCFLLDRRTRMAVGSLTIIIVWAINLEYLWGIVGQELVWGSF